MLSVAAVTVRRYTMLLCLFFPVLALGATSAAKPEFPARSVRMLVPYPPGGGLDLPGRAVGEKFAQSTGKQLVLDNRGGAGGLIAGEIVAKAAPDGYPATWRIRSRRLAFRWDPRTALPSTT